MLQENKSKIASLQRSAALLRKANLRIDGLEKMIADMNTQLAEKSGEVEQLRENLAQMGIKVENLSQEVSVGAPRSRTSAARRSSCRTSSIRSITSWGPRRSS